jgi:hypothetical protein
MNQTNIWKIRALINSFMFVLALSVVKTHPKNGMGEGREGTR